MTNHMSNKVQKVRVRTRKAMSTDALGTNETPKPSVNSNKRLQDYDVGYAKPPKHSQFQKGQSGNAKGRPSGSKNMITSLLNFLDGTVKISKNGKVIKITVRDSLFENLYAQGMKGKVPAIIQLIQMGMVSESKRDSKADTGLSEEDSAMLLEHFKDSLKGGDDGI